MIGNQPSALTGQSVIANLYRTKQLVTPTGKGGVILRPLVLPLLNADGTGVATAVAAGPVITLGAKCYKPYLLCNNVQRFPPDGIQVGGASPLASMWNAAAPFDALATVPEGGRPLIPIYPPGGEYHMLPAGIQIQTSATILGNVATGTRVSVCLFALIGAPWGDWTSYCGTEAEMDAAILSSAVGPMV